MEMQKLSDPTTTTTVENTTTTTVENTTTETTTPTNTENKDVIPEIGTEQPKIEAPAEQPQPVMVARVRPRF